MDIDKHLRSFLRGRDPALGADPDLREASFDYCYNYFQSFREQGCTHLLASQDNLYQSCLTIGFFLASWDMLSRAPLADKSLKLYVPLVQYIASMEPQMWNIDVPNYTQPNILRVLKCENLIV